MQIFLRNKKQDFKLVAMLNNEFLGHLKFRSFFIEKISC